MVYYLQNRLNIICCDQELFIYEHGEKAGCLLAHQLKGRSASQLITTIRKTPQELTIDPQEINNTFKNYYCKLYTSEFPHDILPLVEFLDDLNIPTITQDQQDSLERPIDQK